MRLKHYINEAKDIPWEQIKKDCQPFIKDLKDPKKMLYSGRKCQLTYIKKEIRKNRKPADTPIVIHNWLDDLFKKKFGYKLRSECLFVTARKGIARAYGMPYVIIPIGKIDMYHNTSVIDLYGTLDNEVLSLDYVDTHWQDTDNRNLELITMFKEEAEKLVNTYKKISLTNVDKVEIMLRAKEYYGINADLVSSQDIFDKLKG